MATAFYIKLELLNGKETSFVYWTKDVSFMMINPFGICEMPCWAICTLFAGQSSGEGIIMRYSYESKVKAVELYRKGLWPETPQGMNEYGFRNGK